MRKPKGLLSVNLDLVNIEDDQTCPSFQLDGIVYRQDGVSIGLDYLRMEGITVGTRGELVSSVLTDFQVVGKGAFSTVYRALWNKQRTKNNNSSIDNAVMNTTTPVAVKELNLLDASPQRRKMLLHELKALSRITSPALVHLHGAFLSGDVVTMVLEFMDRGSLDVFIQQHKASMTEATIAPIAYQILVGLSTLHEHRMLHRDLKPSNVILDKSGAVKLCDFGLATLGEQSLSTTVLGTTKYLAPERLSARVYGRPSDLWSFGLLLLECVTGKPPFEEIVSIVDLLVTLQDEEVDFRKLLPEGLQVGLSEMILGSLRLKPAKRIPAAILLQSPWFRILHRIQSTEDAHYRFRLQRL